MGGRKGGRTGVRGRERMGGGEKEEGREGGRQAVGRDGGRIRRY